MRVIGRRINVPCRSGVDICRYDDRDVAMGRVCRREKNVSCGSDFPPRLMIVVPAHDVLKEGDGPWGCDRAL